MKKTRAKITRNLIVYLVPSSLSSRLSLLKVTEFVASFIEGGRAFQRLAVLFMRKWNLCSQLKVRPRQRPRWPLRMLPAGLSRFEAARLWGPWTKLTISSWCSILCNSMRFILLLLSARLGHPWRLRRSRGCEDLEQSWKLCTELLRVRWCPYMPTDSRRRRRTLDEV